MSHPKPRVDHPSPPAARDADDDDGAEMPSLAELGIDPDEDTDLDDADALDLPIGILIDSVDDHQDDGDDRLLVGMDVDAVQDLESCDRQDDDQVGIGGDDLSIGIDRVPEGKVSDPTDDDDDWDAGNEINEARLPALDEDDPEANPLDVGTLDLADEAAMPPWSTSLWQRTPTPLVALPMNEVAIAPQGVVAVGEGLVRLNVVDDAWVEGPTPIDGIGDREIVGVCVVGTSRVVIATHREVVKVDLQQPGRSEILYRSPSTLRGLVVWGDQQVGVIDTDGHMTLQLADGWKGLDTRGKVLCVTREEGGDVWVLLARERELELTRLLKSGELSEGFGLGNTTLAWRIGTVMMAAHGQRIAVGCTSGDLFITMDGGESWAGWTLPRDLTALEVLPSSKPTILATVFVESQDKSLLVAIDPMGASELVADLSPEVDVTHRDEMDESEGLGRSTFLRWDDRIGCVWVAGRFGLAAWRFPSPV